MVSGRLFVGPIQSSRRFNRKERSAAAGNELAKTCADVANELVLETVKRGDSLVWRRRGAVAWLGLQLLLGCWVALSLAAEPPAAPPPKELPSEQIPSNLLMLITSPSPQSLEAANLLFQNRYKFDSVLKEVTFPNNKIDWDFDPGSSRSTYHLWMHSLNTVSYLCNANEMTGDKKYLQKAREVLEDWLSYAKTGTNYFLWYDHPVANRMVTLTYLYQLCDKQGLMSYEEKRQLVGLLYRHAAFLADPKNYSQYNHGVMMDKSLLLASLFLRRSYPESAKQWFDLAIKRIQLGFERDFTPGMVHVENSPAYHFYVSEHFQQMAALMKHFHIDPPPGIADKLALTEVFSRCVTMPNGRVPMVGDTGKMNSPVAPSLDSRAFPDAGIMISCSRAPKPVESTWLLFKSGYLTHTHKHADDLSFVLYGRGKEIFVDGGLLNYDTGNPFATHITSALAHNTLVVDGQSYPIRMRALNGSDPPPWRMFEVSGLVTNQITPDTDVVRGFNAAYAGVALERTLVILKPDVVVIYDIAQSRASHRYSQIFRIGEELRLAHLSSDALLLADSAGQVNSTLVQLLGQALDTRSYDGDRETIRGWGAPQFDQLVPVPQVEFTKAGEQAEFLTIIGIGQKEAEARKLAAEIISVEPEQIMIRTAKGETVSVQRGVMRKAESAEKR